jgi:CheY-like chemotaxis protein/anti-sigma regulatory factor (Ser/Thr protein kinase)
MNKVRIGSKPIEFRLHIDETIPELLVGDELRVKQIFNNLLSNAFKYTHEGYVDWYISAEVSGNSVWLSSRIQDTGIGIKKEDMSKLFSEYNQVDAKSNRRIEGTGLGLSITKRLVELMDGSISVESEYGKGSVFSIRIRQGYVNGNILGKELAGNISGFQFTAERRITKGKLMRVYMPYAAVLVVDDVTVNLDVAKGMLKPYGMTVDCATSGQKAIDLVREAKVKYDAIFMDHMMPDMDGVEAVRIIRNEIGTEYARTVPIIAFTANAIVGNDKLFLQNGFQAFLSKPIDIMQLDVILNRWVRNRDLEKEQTPQRVMLPDAADETLGLSSELKIEGLDFARGVRLFGDKESYLHVLRSFTAHIPAMLDTIRESCPLPEYGAVVHSLKGAAYGICADTVGKKAEELEYAAKSEDRDFVMFHNTPFITRTEKLIRDLNGYLKTTEEEGKPVKDAPDRAVLAKVLEACNNYDIDELDRAISELEQYSYESQPELVPWLREQSRKSEFQEIQEKLAK